jgi:hypothetical protein
VASWRTARKEISDSARRGLQRGQRDLFTMEKALRAEKEKRELDQRKKAHGELCRSLVNEVADAYSRSFPAYEKLGAVLKRHAASERLGLSKSSAGMLLQVSEILDDLATAQAVRAGEIKNIARSMERFDGGVVGHHSVCKTVGEFITEEFEPVVAAYEKARNSYEEQTQELASSDPTVQTEGQAAEQRKQRRSNTIKLSELSVQRDLEQQQCSQAKQQLAEHMRWLDHEHAAILKRGLGDFFHSELRLHCWAMQTHATLFPQLDEMWPNTSWLTGSADRGHWVEGWVHNFLKTAIPEAYSYTTVPAGAEPSAGPVEKQVAPLWLRAGTAAGSQGAPNGCSLVSVKPRVSWVGQIKLDPPDLGWYYRGASAGQGEGTKEIRQVVNRRGTFDKKKMAMGYEYKVRYVKGDEPDAWIPEDQAGNLALRLSLQEKTREAWADRRAALLQQLETARAASQGLESLRRELLIHDQDAWQTVAGWAAHRGASVASLPAQELVETYVRDREARGKNRGITP